jgi:CRP-like cAMP-binding protein
MAMTAKLVRSEIFSRQGRRGAEHWQVSQGSDRLRPGDPADAVFYIQKGKVKITVISEQGKEAVVAMLGTNDFFGEGCLI